MVPDKTWVLCLLARLSGCLADEGAGLAHGPLTYCCFRFSFLSVFCVCVENVVVAVVVTVYYVECGSGDVFVWSGVECSVMGGDSNGCIIRGGC